MEVIYIRKNETIRFVALGGAQQVGMSCYYLQLGKNNILLDCGIGTKNGLISSPDFSLILRPPFMENLSQLDGIFISHAHNDHIGYLTRFLPNCQSTPVYMTRMTSILARHQLYDSDFISGTQSNLMIDYMLNNIHDIDYMNPIHINDELTVTAFQAGHIPGAAMFLIEYNGHNILYTGDYTTDDTNLTVGYCLPENLRVDTLILCGLHAKHPTYVNSNHKVQAMLNNLINHVKRSERVICNVKQLSKGVELLKMLNNQFCGTVNIVLSDEIMQMVEKLEEEHISILADRNRTMTCDNIRNADIVIGNQYVNNSFYPIKVDFSLHDDFFQIIKFIEKLNPGNVIVVHSAPDFYNNNETIEQHIIINPYCNTQFIFPEENEIYTI